MSAIEQPSERRVGDELELIALVGRRFAASLDIEVTLREALERIAELVGAEGGSLFLRESDGRENVCRACVGALDLTGLRLPADEGIVGRCIRERRSQLVRDARKDPHFQASVDEKTGFTTRSILCAPMSVKDDRIGAIELVNKKGGDGLFTTGDLHALEALASSAALAILNARLAAQLVEQERVRRELELAAEIQRNLLPTRPSPDFPIAALNVPAREVSGDFFDFFTLGDGRIAFCVGDVSGKGMNAALLMTKTMSVYRCLGRTLREPGRLLGLVNVEICETVTRGMFVTMVGGLLDPASGQVRLANAGHEPPLVRAPGGGFTLVPAEAPPLGIAPEVEFPETELRLEGGALYIVTDGVTEATLEGGGMLGAEGFQALVDTVAALPIEERLANLVARIAREPLHDDLTMLVVEAGPGGR